ncbi:stress-induced protein, KGG, repeat-containing protein [Gracilibacillus sp. HCP3S3_G5_1]|uniref:stress-induced protein, KGG, repeat-containing protein n=1 Tax=unclassified Gracilibacillus TaxID=2625209 RepID=UPI003F8A04DF
MAQNNNRKMSREEAGRKGGEKVSQKYGQDHFEEIGKKGGETTSDKYDQEHFQEIGKKGGRNSRGNNNNS